jgi:hypothetical protein
MFYPEATAILLAFVKGFAREKTNCPNLPENSSAFSSS